MENNEKIGCSSGRAKIIDPNRFSGLNSFNNVPVPLEDLNISVILRSFRKGRTLLTATDDGNKGTTDNVAQIEVNFIEGSDDGTGKKVLTTKYTDLTTIFDKESDNEETLGITSIDIEFNSSMAPMITINFIDVRGSSIFQNEEKILNNTGNRYTTFFQLPYPMFELEVKGFYGLPVKYCLHMYKFNSKFNSQTGNFEITANFIGFTYAMMSDMLLGYLRAIPWTKIGGEQFEKYKSEGSDVIKLDELADSISDINKGLTKESSESVESTNLNKIELALARVESIKNDIKVLGDVLDIQNDPKKDSYEFIVIKHVDEFDDSQKNDINNVYKVNVKENISGEQGYNILTTIETLDETQFVNIDSTTNKSGGYLIKNITINDLKSAEYTDLSQELKDKILKHINKNNTSPKIGDDKALDIIDLSKLYEKLNKSKIALEVEQNNNKKLLADKFVNVVREKLGFEPTIRPLVECFTASIEVLVESIFRVSESAIANTDRTNELAKKFNDKNTDIHKSHLDNKIYYPWPEYKELDETKGGAYVEKYLGSAGVLENPNNVDELVFIDDLLNAFRKSYKSQQDTINDTAKNETTWYPVNVLDTKLFTTTEPYERTKMASKDDVVRMLVMRFMTLLGISYKSKYMSDEVLLGFAELEVDALLRGIKDDVVKHSLTNINNLDYILNITGQINGKARKLLELNNKGEVKYTYLLTGDTDTRVIPINKGFVDEPNDIFWDSNIDNLRKTRDDNGYIFLTNYGPNNYITGSNNNIKRDDGGIYVKFIDDLGDEPSLISAPSSIKSESTISYDKLQTNDISFGKSLNPFGGKFGVQIFEKMDWGVEYLKDLPFMYIFYRDGDNGLAYTSKVSGKKQNLGKLIPTSKYTLKKGAKYDILGDKDEAYKSPNGYVIHYGLGQNRGLFAKYLNGESDNITYPYIELKFKEREAYETGSFSLFGSPLYYGQYSATIKDKDGKEIDCSEYSKAFLFLHSLPFNINYETLDPFGKTSILNIFVKSSGLIQAPKLWCAYIGAIIWRNNDLSPIIENDKIVGGGTGNKEPLVNINEIIKDLNKNKYFPLYLSDSKSKDVTDDDVISRLPQQVKREFTKIFLDFVNGEGDLIWSDFKSKLEIFEVNNKSDYDRFITYVDKLYDVNNKNKADDVFDLSTLVKDDNISRYYNIVTPDISSNAYHRYLFLQLRDGTPAIDTILKGLTKITYIANTNYNIWDSVNGPKLREEITVDGTKFELYFNKVIEILKSKADSFNPVKQNEKADTAVFGTANKDIIKLQLYRTCKNIYDKWLGGAKSIDNLVFQCGGRSLVDTGLAKKYRNSDKPRMIDSFRFVSRSFRDIGHELYVNPIPINEMLIGNVNSSSYDVISKLLASNNFNFIALPNFINFRDDKILESLFRPYSYNQNPFGEGTCGPSFVCTYVGQGSKHLDFGSPTKVKNEDVTSKYPNDGFDLRCDGTGSGVENTAPVDFTTGNVEEYEEPVSAFVVRYSQQNQNIFKDINLDQSEFSETDESLQIQDEISQKGSENNRSIVGQNIYNVYAVRSYTAQVEMMGNAMIQPMMYFQLDNIPMFHGAYLITKVNHSIKPNSMTTNFTGTRVRYPETKLVDAQDVYMDLLETFDTSGAGTGGGAVGSGSVPSSSAPILQTLIDNGCTGSNINSGYIKACKVPNLPGVKYMTGPNTQMICEAVEPLKEMVKDLVAWMKKEKIKAGGQDGSYVYITSMFRTNGSNSMHAFGLALDFQFFDKDGNIFMNQEENASNVKNAFDFTKNPALKWLYQHAYEYGFVQPHWANDGNKVGSSDGEEWWHWEYHGKAAIYQIRNRPIPAVGNNKTTDNPVSDIKESKIKSFVHNPKGRDGKEAVYKNMDYKTTRVSDKITSKVGCPSLPTSNKTNVKAKDIYQEIKKVTKLNNYAIAGIMGNIYQESNFIPQAFNSDGGGCGAYGLIQWRGDRLDKLSNLAKSDKTTIDDYKLQIKMMNNELGGTWKYTLEALKKVTSASDAAKIFSKTYEAGNLGQIGFDVNTVLSETPDDIRSKNAKAFYDNIIKGNFS